MAKTSLSSKQRRFVEEYLVDLNGTQAAIRAGYSPKTARKIASNMLSEERIGEAVREAQACRSKRVAITQDQVVAELARIAFFNIGRIATWDEDGVHWKGSDDISEDDLAAIDAIKETVLPGNKGERAGRRMELSTNSKLKALELVGKHLGMWRHDDDDASDRDAKERGRQAIAGRVLDSIRGSR